MSTGLFDWLGAEQNLTVLAGRAWERELEFVDTTDGGREGMDVSDVTFDGVVTGADGREVGIEVSHREEGGGSLLLVVFPALEAGVYRWELRAVDESGEKRRMMYGRLGVLATGLDLAREASDEVAALRMRALVPGRDARRIMAEWRATTRALRAADAAAESAAAAKEAEERVVESTLGMREKLEGMMGEVEATREKADGLVRRLEVYMVEFEDKVRSVVWVDPETGHLFIGGVDTLCKVTGEAGKSPYVDEAGDWQYWDDETGQWRNGGPARGEDGFAPYLDAEGYLVYRDWLTGEVRRSAQPMKGRDGRDGASVRRILVDRVEDIPQEGETCNGGVYYYVPNVDDMPRAVIEVLAEGRSGDERMVIDGVEVELPGAELAVEEAALALAGSIEGACSWLRAEADGAKVLLYAVGEGRQTLTVNRSGGGYAVLEVPMEDREGYHVFAWVEQVNGEAGWVRVGMANDVATREVYGLTKLGTDVVVEAGGAPVGVNEAGEMAVPHADYTTAGAMLPSAEETLGSGDGVVGFDASGRARVPLAGYRKSGVVSLSWRGEAAVPIIGAMADGTLGTVWATLNQAGVIRLGSEFGQGNPIPYRVGVGADEGHHLANNLVYGGAYKHMSPQAWRALALPWLDAVIDANPGWFGDAYYSGLHTSLQFTQSAENGLELLGATGSLRAGVYLAMDMERDERDDAVASAKTVRDWVHAECYSKEALEEKFKEYAKSAEVKEYVASALGPYEKTSKLLERDYATNGRVTQLDGENVKCTDGVQRIYVLAPEAFEASRGKRDARGLYIKATM